MQSFHGDQEQMVSEKRFENLIRVGHRGFPREFPGNTLKGFRRAMDLGCQMVECDIRRSVDGVLMLAHDDDVQHADGVVYEISQTTSDVLRGLNLGTGEGVPTLAELVQLALDRQCAVMADMKCGGGDVEELTVATLAPLPVSLKLVPGAGPESRARFHALDRSLPLSLSWGVEHVVSQPGGWFERVVAEIDTDAVTWEHPLLTAERVEKLHRLGLRVFAWTVDSLDTMVALEAMGVDGIISNRADLLNEVMP
jgi:glycerophosphoryl diester phosphodiesterase